MSDACPYCHCSFAAVCPSPVITLDISCSESAVRCRFVYDGVLESQFVMVHDANKQLLGVADIYPGATFFLRGYSCVSIPCYPLHRNPPFGCLATCDHVHPRPRITLQTRADAAHHPCTVQGRDNLQSRVHQNSAATWRLLTAACGLLAQRRSR